MVTGYIALGGNQGDVIGNFRMALRALQDVGLELVAVSSLYLTAPQGESDQPDFINGVIAVKGDMAAEGILALLQNIEVACGRNHSQKGPARPIDLDIIFWGDETSAKATITLPHPRWRERDFVCTPLAEVMSDDDRKRYAVPSDPPFQGIKERIAGPGEW